MNGRSNVVLKVSLKVRYSLRKLSCLKEKAE